MGVKLKYNFYYLLIMSTLFLFNNKIISALFYYNTSSNNVTPIIKKFIDDKKEKFVVSTKEFKCEPHKKKQKKIEILTEKHILTIPENTTCILIYDDFVINKYNNDLKNLLLNKNINIFGKGPSFKNIPKEENSIHICINSSLNFIDECDIFCFNDLETMDKIDLNKLKNVKYIFIPEYLHHKGKNSIKNIWYIVYLKLKKYFNGKYILFNLYDTPFKNHQIINIDSGYSTALTITEYICKYYYYNLKKIDYYGIGITNKLYYNNIFKETDNVWNEKNIKNIRNKIINLVKKYNIEYNLN